MKLYIFLSIFNFVKTFEVFDCASDPRNVKTWDLLDVGKCEIPEDQFKNGTDFNGQIVKNQVKKQTTICTCKFLKTVTATKCGFEGI